MTCGRVDRIATRTADPLVGSSLVTPWGGVKHVRLSSHRSKLAHFSKIVCGAGEVVKFDRELDAEGLLCPEPLMLARNALREMSSGEVLYVRATDPSTHRDFQNLCRFMGHELLQAEVDTPSKLEYWIQRA